MFTCPACGGVLRWSTRADGRPGPIAGPHLSLCGRCGALAVGGMLAPEALRRREDVRRAVLRLAVNALRDCPGVREAAEAKFVGAEEGEGAVEGVCLRLPNGRPSELGRAIYAITGSLFTLSGVVNMLGPDALAGIAMGVASQRPSSS